MDVLNVLDIAASGMKAQGTRMRVLSENIANADTLAGTPGEDPYRRQTISFKTVMDRETGANLVEIKRIGQDRISPFGEKFMPDHPGANEAGIVKTTNVNTMLELMDMREAQRSYEANLGMIEQARAMALRTISLLEA